MSDQIALFFQQTVNGLAISGIYALIALGITVQFGLTRLLNFAQGAFVILGAYVAASLSRLGLPFVLAALGAAAAIGLLSLAAERGLFRWTLNTPVNGFVISLGLVIVFEMSMVKIWSAEIDRVPSPVHGTLEVFGVILTYQRMLLLGVSAALLAGFFILLRFTSFGRSLRAVAEDREASEFVGLKTNRVITGAFVAGGVLAGIGGALVGVVFPFTPFSGGLYIVKGFIVAIVGGLGNVTGAVVGALLIGMVETYGVAYWEPAWKDGFGFVMLILIMVLRPQGLFRGTFESAH